jgi:hypothetical protein
MADTELAEEVIATSRGLGGALTARNRRHARDLHRRDLGEQSDRAAGEKVW